MAHNINATAGSGPIKVATKETTHSGDAQSHVQMVQPVHTDGGEPATLTEFTDTTGIPVHVRPPTTPAGSRFHLVSLGSNNAQNIKASPGTVYRIRGFNKAAATRYLKFFNQTGSPNPAADTVVETVALASGLPFTEAVDIPFSSGISLAIVAELANNDNTSVGAGDVVIDVGYY